jgi:parallel beta-helix repeat protein
MKRLAIIVCAILLITVFPPQTLGPSKATSVAGRIARFERAEYQEHPPIQITSDSDFQEQGFPGLGTPQSPFLIQDLLINTSENVDGISIENTRAFFIVNSCYLCRGDFSRRTGLYLSNVTNALIEENQILGYDYGLFLGNGCENNTLVGNTLIDLPRRNIGVDQSDNNILMDNNCSGGSNYGIRAMGSDNTTIVSNTLSGLYEACIDLISCTNVTLMDNRLYSRFNYAMHLETVTDVIIRNNTSESGPFYAHWMTYSVVKNNTFRAAEAVGYALELSYCNDTLLTWNVFLAKIETFSGERIAFDCNYYVDYVGSDEDGDGIGDTPYYLHGIWDEHPLIRPPWFPTINSPADFSMDISEEGNCIEWNPRDSDPLNYTVYLNGEKLAWGKWNSSEEMIAVVLEGLEHGIHNYTIVVMDEDYDRVSDTVYVTITESVAPILDSPEDIACSEFSSGNSIIWTPSDAHPFWQRVYRNGSIRRTEEWNGSEITVDVDGLTLGLWNYTVQVEDVDGNTAQDVVMVTVFDGTPPTLDRPNDVLLEEGTTDYTVTWNPIDHHPESYVITRNGVTIASGSWNSTNEIISVFLGDYLAGEYNLTLIVTDIGGNSASDSVQVTVRMGLGGIAMYALGFGSAVAVLAIVLLFLKRR